MERNSKGQFLKGHHYNKKTEFQTGYTWRKPKPFWKKEWLLHEYCTAQKSASEIANKRLKPLLTQPKLNEIITQWGADP